MARKDYQYPRVGSKDARTRRASALLSGGKQSFRRIGVGTDEPQTGLHVVGETAAETEIRIERATNTTSPAIIRRGKARGTMLARTAVLNGDELVRDSYYGYVGSTNKQKETVRVVVTVTGTPADTGSGVLESTWDLQIGDTAGALQRILRVLGSGLQIEQSLTLKEIAEPSDPAADYSVIWISNGTGIGEEGDLMVKTNIAGTVTGRKILTTGTAVLFIVSDASDEIIDDAGNFLIAVE